MVLKIVQYYLPVTIKGILMGAADVIPGVSGGTIAFITGIYETLIASLKSINSSALRKLFRFEFHSFWKTINGSFLLSLFLGILISIITLSNTIVFLLENHVLLLLSFFFGLIIASAVVIVRKVKTHSLIAWTAGLLGMLSAFVITSLSPVTTPESWWFIFLSGAIAICAMILPGISGSFILLLLGKYSFILEAIKEFNVAVIAVFGVGCLVGLLGFVRILSKLLQRYHDQTMMLLAGIMIGSLTKVWPWKIAVADAVADGKNALLFSSNVTPETYLQTTGSDPMVTSVMMLMVTGLILVFFLEYVSTKTHSNLTDYSS
ncbi:DUF368 domain-containing protein [Prosthecochloris sp. SCSIO W1101]|uniref:DUF368 domain-containing protein n=1 Tax=Prosthecochloris sp. SCSIO W1101 TaxID=2992242 RepID=UPI00223E6C0E|nr:DUF368 domain-containing protein [Prosthecochloris sp. SCSIO W1101]UZJ42063.1 DUF368 domain-containing protein [Prosthecochloris sp. SCSIO W1101]